MKTEAVNILNFNGILKNPDIKFSKKQQKVIDGIEYQLTNRSFDNYFFNSLQALDIENFDIYLDSKTNGKVNLSIIKKTNDLKKINKKSIQMIDSFGLDNIQSVNTKLSTCLKEYKQEKSRIKYLALIALMSLGSLFLSKKYPSVNIYDRIVKVHSNVQNSSNVKHIKNVINVYWNKI